MGGPTVKSSRPPSNFPQETINSVEDDIEYRFGGFTLDVPKRELHYEEQPVLLSPKAFDTLAFLAAHRERVVTKRELMDHLWPDAIVEESNLTQTIFVLRKALQSHDGTEEYIATVPRVGYRFTAQVSSNGGEPALHREARDGRLIGQAIFWWAALAVGVLVAASTAAWFAFYRGESAETTSLEAADDAPIFEPLTFKEGGVTSARYAPDGNLVVYGARWAGAKEDELYVVTPGTPSSSSLRVPASLNWRVGCITTGGDVLYRSGDMLVRSSMTGGTAAAVSNTAKLGMGVDCDTDGRQVAIVRRASGNELLEYPVGKVLADTPGQFGEIRISRKSGAVAFTEHPLRGDDMGNVGFIDATGQKKILSTGWYSVQGIGWSPSEREIWFTGGKETFANAIWAVSLDGRLRVLARFPPMVILQDVAADGRVLLIRAIHRMTTTVGAKSDDGPLKDISYLDYDYVADMSPDGRRLVFYNWEAKTPVTYLRTLDGSAPLRIGEGRAEAMSLDGRWIIAIRDLPRSQLVLLSTGAAPPRVLDTGGVRHFVWATWMPDGESLAFVGNEEGHQNRLYVQNVNHGPPRPVSEEGVYDHSYNGHPISPDGKFAAILFGPEHTLYLCELATGRSRPLAGSQPFDQMVRWAGDGRSLFILADRESPYDMIRLDVTTGQRTTWRDLSTPGCFAVNKAVTTPDGGIFVASCINVQRQLFQVRGLH